MRVTAVASAAVVSVALWCKELLPLVLLLRLLPLQLLFLASTFVAAATPVDAEVDTAAANVGKIGIYLEPLFASRCVTLMEQVKSSTSTRQGIEPPVTRIRAPHNINSSSSSCSLAVQRIFSAQEEVNL